MTLLESPHRRRKTKQRFVTAERIFEILEERVLLANGINPSGAPTIMGAPGVPLTNVVVATYTISDSTGSPGSKWNGLINWGDGTANSKNVLPTALPDGSFEFLGTHTYSAAGTFTISVMIAVPGSHDPGANTVQTTAIISNSVTLQSIAVTPANPSVPKGLTQQFTATGTFSDNSTQNLTNQVTWASATPSVATITAARPGHGRGDGHLDDQRHAGRRDRARRC